MLDVGSLSVFSPGAGLCPRTKTGATLHEGTVGKGKYGKGGKQEKNERREGKVNAGLLDEVPARSLSETLEGTCGSVRGSMGNLGRLREGGDGP
jgi:hypothetical protein